MRRAKILATLGPSSTTQESIEEMIESGLSAVRINMSHGTQEEHAVTIRNAREAAAALDMPLSILVGFLILIVVLGAMMWGFLDYLQSVLRDIAPRA